MRELLMTPFLYEVNTLRLLFSSVYHGNIGCYWVNNDGVKAVSRELPSCFTYPSIQIPV